MFSNPYIAEQLAREHMRDAQREAEQSRLLNRAGGRARPKRWRVVAAVFLLVGGFLSGLLQRSIP